MHSIPIKPWDKPSDATIKVLSDDNPDKKTITERVHNLLESVGLTAQYATRFPNQLSGGEKQRVAIAQCFRG